MKRLTGFFSLSLLLIGCFVLLTSLHNPPQIVAQPASLHKVIAAPHLFDAGSEGVTRWHDYGAFTLYAVSDAALAQLPMETRRQLTHIDNQNHILIDGYSFDTQQKLTAVPAQLQAAPAGYGLQLVQFVGPVKQGWLQAIRAAGGVPVHYIAHNAYLVWVDGAGRHKLQRFVQERTFLQYSAPYQPFFKLSPALRTSWQAAETEAIPVTIQMYRHPGSAETEVFVQERLTAIKSEWEPILSYQNIAGTVPAGDLAAIAQRPDVVWIGQRFERELTDEIQGQILAANFNAGQSAPAAPGYLSWLSSYQFSTNPADYPIVDIVDDGIGNGTIRSGDPTLHLFGNENNPSRLAYVANCTAADGGGGPDGHGHLNVSIAGGYDTRAGFPYRDTAGYQLGLGVNPFGRFAGTRVFAPSFDLSACGDTDTALIRRSQNSGAQISSNSWGCSGCAGTYDTASQAYDVGVRDADLATPGNQALTFIFSAGNSGPNAGTIGSPANGKNVIAVGAAENYRPDGRDGCYYGTTAADSAMDIIGFSSRGPAPGGRVKPEIVAPGTHIQGTASSHPSYNGSAICGGQSSPGSYPFYPASQELFTWSSGTSHAAPAVAGVVSLYYYWLARTYGIDAPSPAILKAYLLAHTTYLSGTGANDTLPSNSQGYGMPAMTAAFDDTPRYLLDQSVRFDDSGETWTFHGYVADPSRPLRIVMAYTDQAGMVGSSPQVNDLNLTAAVGETTYRGNHFEGQWSVAGGTADSANNYEAIFLPPGLAAGQPLTVTVTAYNVAGDGVANVGDGTDQDFALVCYNCARHPDFSLSLAPAIQSICAPDVARFDVNVGQILAYGEDVFLQVEGAPPETAVSFSDNPITPPGHTTLTIDNTKAAENGRYTLAVTGIAPPLTRTTTLALELFTARPGAPSLTSPVNDAIAPPDTSLLSWTPVAQALSYNIEIATDRDFTNVVESASGLVGTTYRPRELGEATVYYWRVWANNRCGGGDYSDAFRFAVTAGETPGKRLYLPLVRR